MSERIELAQRLRELADRVEANEPFAVLLDEIVCLTIEYGDEVGPSVSPADAWPDKWHDRR